MFGFYELTPRDEDEMEDFRDFDDENAEVGSKLDDYNEMEDEEEDEEHHAPMMPSVGGVPVAEPPAPAV